MTDTLLTPHFSRGELACRCGCGRMEIPREFVQKLENLRQACAFPFPISSGYRCPDYNARVSSTGRDGPHTKSAVDIRVSGAQAWVLVGMATRYGFKGIGIAQKGPHGSRFIHLDDLPDAPGQPRPTIWSY